MATDAFARDLGYLGQFFDKLEAHAAALSPEAGARLRALIGEERARWAEIRALVGQSAPRAAASTDASPARAAPTTAAAPTSAAAPSAATPSARRPQKSDTRTPLTVGSLIGRD